MNKISCWNLSSAIGLCSLLLFQNQCWATASSSNLKLFERLQNQIIEISEQLTPAVVHIDAIVKQDIQKIEISGSGFITDEQGHILTNEHMVTKAEKVTVTIPGYKKKFSATIIGTDKQTDIALLKIDPPKSLSYPSFGDSDQVKVGQWVVAIGNPYGLDGTVSFGVVSAKGRNLEIESLINEFIQTDAMIDVGSSGGPLVNLKGEVIGVNSLGQGRGIGFTIPINTALDIKEKLLEEGTIERSWLGIHIQPLDRDLAEYFQIPDKTGVIVTNVIERSPAQQAQIEVSDIITSFNGTKIEAEEMKDLKDVIRMVAKTQVGSTAEIGIIRNQKAMKLKATLALQPKVEPKEVEESEFGFHLKEITHQIYLNYLLQTKEGVLVSFVESGSAAFEAELSPGDVIIEVERNPVKDLNDYSTGMKQNKNVPAILLTVIRGRDTIFILLKRTGAKEQIH